MHKRNKLAQIENKIYEIRGQKVMLDSDLAVLYQVETFNLNKAVKRNIGRFPRDFMFQLTKAEWENLIFHFGISSLQHGGRRSRPYVFTEQGVAMLASVLNSPKAVIVNIGIMRAFVKLRHYVLSQNKDEQIAELRKLLLLYIEKNDKRVNEIIIALNNLIDEPPKTKRIGFNAEQ